MSDRTGLNVLPRLLLLLFVCAFVYLIGNASVPLWDRDEPRFAQTSRQMLQSGDWVVPRLYDNVRTAKPPLIYWLQASSMKVFGAEGGSGVFAARLPSVLAMLSTLCVVGWTLWHWIGPRHALWTVLILSSSALVVLAAKAGLTDSVLLLFVTVTQLCLYAVWRGRGSWTIVFLMSSAIALALLTKGPVAVGVQLMTLLALEVLRRTLRPTAPTDAPVDGSIAHPRGTPTGRLIRVVAKASVGLLIIAAIGLPWVRLVEQRHPGFIRTAYRHELKDRATSGLEGHTGPPGYYLVSIWPTFLPWSLILPLALVSGWKHRQEPQVRFALAAVAGPWLMFEIVKTKLPHYLLPCFPPLAFLAADSVVRILSLRPTARPDSSVDPSTVSSNPLTEPPFLNAVLIWGAVAVALGMLPWLAWRRFGSASVPVNLALTMAVLAYAVVVIAMFRHHRLARALAAMGLGMLVLCAVLFGLYLPRARFMCLSADVAGVLREHDAVHPGSAIMLDYKEPSLAFYQGGTIREEIALVATDRLLAKSPEWLVMTREVYDANATDRSQLEIIASFRGLDLSASLRNVEVLVVRKRVGGLR